jgi:ribosomal-protein-alanine N-acetyltransferase
MEFEIVKMKQEHLVEILKIEEELFPEPWTAEFFAYEIEQGDSLVAKELLTGEIIGYVCGWAVLDEYSITNVGVGKRYQKQGIAKKMITHLMQKKLTEKVVVFYLEVRETNIPAINLYRNIGFQTIAKRLKYYRNPVEDALVMKYQS